MSRIWDKRAEDRWEGFICRCSDEGRQEADELMAEVRKFLGEKVNPANFLSSVVYTLEHEFDSAYITGIFCDLWAAVDAETYDKSFSVLVQCDEVEDGVAGVLWAFMHKGKEDEQPAEEDPGKG